MILVLEKTTKGSKALEDIDSLLGLFKVDLGISNTRLFIKVPHLYDVSIEGEFEKAKKRAYDSLKEWLDYRHSDEQEMDEVKAYVKKTIATYKSTWLSKDEFFTKFPVSDEENYHFEYDEKTGIEVEHQFFIKEPRIHMALFFCYQIYMKEANKVEKDLENMLTVKTDHKKISNIFEPRDDSKISLYSGKSLPRLKKGSPSKKDPKIDNLILHTSLEKTNDNREKINKFKTHLAQKQYIDSEQRVEYWHQLFFSETRTSSIKWLQSINKLAYLIDQLIQNGIITSTQRPSMVVRHWFLAKGEEIKPRSFTSAGKQVSSDSVIDEAIKHLL